MISYYSIYAGTDINDMTLVASPDNNSGVLSPMIEKEINTAGSFSFTMLPTHPYANSIKRYLTIVEVYLREMIVFRGRVFEISTDFYNHMKITCEGNLAWLVDNYKPKSDEVLENSKPFTSEVKNKIAAYNEDMESYKHFSMGITDPANYVGNMIDMETAVMDKKINLQDGRGLDDAENWICATGYINYDVEETYYLYVGSYEKELGTSNVFYLYGSFDQTYTVVSPSITTVAVRHDSSARVAFPVFTVSNMSSEYPITVEFDDGTIEYLREGPNPMLSKFLHDGVNVYLLSGSGTVRVNAKNAVGYFGYITGGELTEAKISTAGFDPDLVNMFRVSGPFVQPLEPVHPDLDYDNQLYIRWGNWNIRTRPSSKASSIGIVSAGETYEYVNTTSSRWVEFIYNGKNVYVYNTSDSTHGPNLEIRPNSTPSPSPEPQPSGDVSERDLFWVSVIDVETETVDGSTWGGGTWGEYMNQWLVDTHHMLMRARVVNGKNVLDILNPKRNAAPVSEMVFADNMIDFEAKNPSIEAYSYIYPIFEGEAYPSEFPPEKISDAAVSAVGKIYKAIDFGVKPDKDNQKKIFRDRMEKVKSLYDPTIPQQFTIKGLDKQLVYEDENFSIIDVGDSVRIRSRYHINGQVNRICLNLKIDVFNPENSEYTIGQYVDDSENVRIKSLTESFVKADQEAKKKK